MLHKIEKPENFVESVLNGKLPLPHFPKNNFGYSVFNFMEKIIIERHENCHKRHKILKKKYYFVFFATFVAIISAIKYRAAQ